MAVLRATPSTRAHFVSTDLDETREYLDHTYGWRMGMLRPSTTGEALTVAMTDAGMVSSAHARAPGDISYHVTGGDYVVIDTLLRGVFELEHDGGIDRYGPGDIYIANQPEAEFSSSTHDIRVLTTILPSDLLAAVATADSDQPAPLVKFLSYNPVPGMSQHWRDVSRFVDNLLNNPDTGDAPLVIGPAARLLAATALATFPNSAVAGPTVADHHDGHPDTLRRAVAFIEANPDLDIGVADIARAAHVTPRAVQLAFRRQLDTTPMAYLRRVRLDRAHNELQATTPDEGATVTAIASRWGFARPSRFAALYRAAYGRPPRDTLSS